MTDIDDEIEEDIPEPLDMDDMEELMEEMDIEVVDVPAESDVEELMEGDYSQDEEFFEELDEPEPEVIPEIPDNKQPINNMGVDESEVAAIQDALEKNYLQTNFLNTEELMGLLPNEVVSPVFVPEGETTLNPTQMMLENLEGLLGDRATGLIVDIANSGDAEGGIKSIATLVPLGDIARIDVLDDKDGRPRFIQLIDINGVDVTASLGLPLNQDGEIEVHQVLDNSVFTNLEHDSINRYKADAMGAAIQGALSEFESLIGEKQRRQERINLLKWMRTLIFKLNDVFGFDDYRQLEALMAAWLMKNSTCRLSGIPGTGKTTVINCAATLLGNSYGYHTAKTYAAGTQYMSDLGKNAQKSNFFGNNQTSSNIYKAVEFDKGMYYDIKYNKKEYEGVASDWNEWRFTEWPTPKLDSNGNHDYSKVQRSGAYLYNFKFLRNQEDTYPKTGTMIFPPVDSKKEVTSETFRDILTNCWEVRVPEDFNLNIFEKDGTNSYVENPQWDPASDEFKESKKIKYIKPIQILDDQGGFVGFEQGSKPKYGPYLMSLRNAQHDSQFYGQMLGSIPQRPVNNLSSLLKWMVFIPMQDVMKVTGSVK